MLGEHDLARLNIGRRYWRASVHSISESASHRPEMVAYCREIGRHRREGHGLVFWGVSSVGKTYVASAILKYAVTLGYSAYAVLADQVVPSVVEDHVFEDTLRDGRVTTLMRMHAADFLLLDDLGREYHATSGFAARTIEGLLRFRSRELRPTLTTTNLTPMELADRYGSTVVELFRESAAFVRVTASVSLRASEVVSHASR